MNDFVLSIILSEIEHQGWDNIYPPKFKECAVEIYQAIEKAGYCITPTMRTAKPKPTPTPSLGLLECGEMRTDKRFTQSTLTALQAKLEKAIEALKLAKEHCLCERFKTKGFDYQQNHTNLGKPRGGSRWNTPKDIIEEALKELEAE